MDRTVTMTVWEESRRLLIRQEADLDTLRTRAVTVLSVAAAVAGLFLPRLPDSRSVFANVALGCAALVFATLAALIIRGLLHPEGFTFSNDLDRWVGFMREDDPQGSMVNWTYNKTRDFNNQRIANQARITRMYGLFRFVCWLLLAEVLLLVAAAA
jgi:hypothetical protein